MLSMDNPEATTKAATNNTHIIQTVRRTHSVGLTPNRNATTLSPEIGSSFQPCPLLDVSVVKYCTYCFTSSHELPHDLSSECILAQLPYSDYWPDNWTDTKCLSWNFSKCVRGGCLIETETPDHLLRHVIKYHKAESSCEGQVENEALHPSSHDSSSLEDMGDSNSRSIKTEDNDTIIKSEPQCSTSFGDDHTTLGNITRHDKRTHYSCHYCKSGTPDLNVITQHFAHVHNITKVYVCEECMLISNYSKTLRNHHSKHHTDKASTPVPLYIKISDEPFDNSLMVPSCIYKYNGLEGGPVKTESSTAMKLTEDTLENYNAFVLGNLSNYRIKCKLCPYSTKLLPTFKYHILAKHCTAISETLVNITDNSVSYRCTTCAVVLRTKLQISFHYVKSHHKVPKILCQLCDVAFDVVDKLAKHLHTESHGDLYRRSLRCDKCLFATLTKKDLVQHQSEHAPDFKCDKCNFVTKQESKLSKHYKYIHGFEKGPDNLYHCGECSYFTGIKKDIIHHQSIGHSTLNNFPCARCSFVAASCNGLVIHMRVHNK